jgi:hypothetical protein
MAGLADAWFAGQPGAILVYRVNRRPLREISLFADKPPSVFEHFRGVLAPGWAVVSGRRHQREWKVGGIQSDAEQELLVGKLGWLPRGEAMVPSWSDEDKDWTSSITAPAGGQVMPFGFDGDSRLLAILHDGSSAPSSVANAFQKILEQNEAQLLAPTTEWAVEPVLDSKDFIEWLASAEIVRSVSFTARLPNPEPDFNDLAERLDRRHAKDVTETMRARDDGGLVGVEQDPDFCQAIEMGAHGFATMRGRGQIDGRATKYSQKDQVARERVDEVPPTWDDVFGMLKALLKNQLRRFLDDHMGA